MVHKEIKKDWETKGGVLEIPDGWFVSGANFDAEEPFIEISYGELCEGLPDRKLPVPKSMARYLSMHWCGSEDMHRTICANERQRVQADIKGAFRTLTGALGLDLA